MIKGTSGRCLSFFSMVVLVVMITGCAKYTFREAGVAKIRRGAMLGVSVLESSTKDLTGPTALEGYLTAALIGAKFQVRPLNLEVLAGRSMLRRLLPDGAYSLRKAMARGIGRGGEIEADKPFIERTLNSNELHDARSRLQGFTQLARAIPKDLNLDYMVVVHKFDTFGFAAYVVDLKKVQYIRVIVMSGNRDGYEEALGDPEAGTAELAQDGDETRMEMLRLAEFLAQRL